MSIFTRDYLQSEWEANVSLKAMQSKEGYAQYDFNLAGDRAKEVLRKYNASKATGIAKLVSKISYFFKG